MKTNATYSSDLVVGVAVISPERVSDGTLHRKTYDTERTKMSHVDIKKSFSDLCDENYGYLFVKRAFDIVVSFFGLIILSPIFLILTLAIRIDSKGRAIFSQVRVGKDGKHFKFYKFRSMVTDAENKRLELLGKNEMDGPAFKIIDDPRVTRIGRFIRKTSIDELPQLFNVLKGDMSLVGPRPPLPDEVEKYTPYQMRRLDVKGGLTCFWQISGRNTIGFDEWVKMDLDYIEKRTFITDLKIIFKTFRAVISQKGAC